MFKHIEGKGYHHVASSLHGQAIERGSSAADAHHFEHPVTKNAVVAKRREKGWNVRGLNNSDQYGFQFEDFSIFDKRAKVEERQDIPKYPGH